MIFNVAIVEDEKKEAEKLEKLLRRSFDGVGQLCKIKTFLSAVTFCEQYRADYDVIFFDIEMPDMTGMEAARFVRERDEKAVIVFVTNMIQCAVEGYTVNAFDFIVKPINEGSFAIKFDRILNMMKKNTDDTMLTLNATDGTKRVKVSDIVYIEVRNHHLTYYMTDGEITVRGSLAETEKLLGANNFGRCNSCYLVNLKYVTEFHGDYITVNGDSLKVSQTKKQQFMSDFAKYLGGGAC